MGCVRLAAGIAVVVLGLYVVVAGVQSWAKAPEVFPFGPGVTVLLGVIIASIGSAIASSFQRDGK